MTPAIETWRLTRTYRGVKALSGLTLTIPRGVIFGLVGVNGAGKTTALKILSTLLAPTTGWASVCGFDTESQPGEVRRRLGYLPDPPAAYGEMRTHEFLQYFAGLYQVSAPVQRAEQILALTGLTELRDRPVSGLSRGTVQRLGVARCLLHQPEVLLLDEPASALDPLARRELLSFLREIRAMGSTVVLSSHLLADLEEICDQVCILHAGSVVACGSIAELRCRHGIRARTEIRLSSGADAAEAVLRARAEVRHLSRDGDRLEFECGAGAAGVAELIPLLVDRGAQVASVRERAGTLEEIFLAATAGRSAGC